MSSHGAAVFTEAKLGAPTQSTQQQIAARKKLQSFLAQAATLQELNGSDQGIKLKLFNECPIEIFPSDIIGQAQALLSDVNKDDFNAKLKRLALVVYDLLMSAAGLNLHPELLVQGDNSKAARAVLATNLSNIFVSYLVKLGSTQQHTLAKWTQEFNTQRFQELFDEIHNDKQQRRQFTLAKNQTQNSRQWGNFVSTNASKKFKALDDTVRIVWRNASDDIAEGKRDTQKLKNISDHARALSELVSREILQTDSLETRIQAIEEWIDIMDFAYKQGNFFLTNCILKVFNGIIFRPKTGTALDNLATAKSLLSPASIQILEFLCSQSWLTGLTSNEGNRNTVEAFWLKVHAHKHNVIPPSIDATTSATKTWMGEKIQIFREQDENITGRFADLRQAYVTANPDDSAVGAKITSQLDLLVPQVDQNDKNRQALSTKVKVLGEYNTDLQKMAKCIAEYTPKVVNHPVTKHLKALTSEQLPDLNIRERYWWKRAQQCEQADKVQFDRTFNESLTDRAANFFRNNILLTIATLSVAAWVGAYWKTKTSYFVPTPVEQAKIPSYWDRVANFYKNNTIVATIGTVILLPFLAAWAKERSTLISYDVSQAKSKQKDSPNNSKSSPQLAGSGTSTPRTISGSPVSSSASTRSSSPAVDSMVPTPGKIALRNDIASQHGTGKGINSGDDIHDNSANLSSNTSTIATASVEPAATVSLPGTPDAAAQLQTLTSAVVVAHPRPNGC